MNDAHLSAASRELSIYWRARVLCLTAEPHAFEARPCQAHTDEARRQLTSPAVAPASFGSVSAGRAEEAGGAAGHPPVPAVLVGQSAASPSNENRLVVRSDEPAEWATAIAREGA